MNIDTLVEYVVIKKTQILTYEEKIEIINSILKMQETLPQVEGFEISALGLQTLSDSNLVIAFHDCLFLNAIQFFMDIEK